MFGNQLRRKARVPIKRHGYLDCAKVAGDGLSRLAVADVVAGVGYRAVSRVPQMLVHFPLERGFDDGFGQLLEHAVFAN